MREILFRGKRLENGEWTVGWYEPPIEWDGHKFGTTICYICDEGYLEDAEVDPATVGQYTGLNDKNGKRIFEGDIVKFRTRKYEFNVPLCVIWREDEVCFVGAFRDCIRAYSMNKSWTYEVIGNIHDNPELMQGGADG